MIANPQRETPPAMLLSLFGTLGSWPAIAVSVVAVALVAALAATARPQAAGRLANTAWTALFAAAHGRLIGYTLTGFAVVALLVAAAATVRPAPAQQFALRERDIGLIEREMAYRQRVADLRVGLVEANRRVLLENLRDEFAPQIEEAQQRLDEVTGDFTPSDQTQ